MDALAHQPSVRREHPLSPEWRGAAQRPHHPIEAYGIADHREAWGPPRTGDGPGSGHAACRFSAAMCFAFSCSQLSPVCATICTNARRSAPMLIFRPSSFTNVPLDVP